MTPPQPPTDPFARGVISMARNTLPAIALVRSGKWTLDQMERWVRAVISNDPKFMAEADLGWGVHHDELIKEALVIKAP